MIIHGVVQGTANGSRAWMLRKHLAWKILPPYLLGAALSFGAFASVAFLPNVHWVMIAIGSLPWIALIVPKLNGLDVTHPTTAVVCGTSVTAAQLFAGASGPLLDFFYLHARLDRYQVVANKALTQTIGHMLKLVYYGGVVGVSGDGIDPLFLGAVGRRRGVGNAPRHTLARSRRRRRFPPRQPLGDSRRSALTASPTAHTACWSRASRRPVSRRTTDRRRSPAVRWCC